MRKLLIVENTRRGWLVNIINSYILLFIFPYYVIGSNYGVWSMVLYGLLLVSVGALLVFRVMRILIKDFVGVLSGKLGLRKKLDLVFLVIYGDCVPRVSYIFVPILIFLSMTIDSLPIQFLYRAAIVFIIMFILIFFFAFLNMRNISRNIDKIKKLLEETQK